MTAPRRCRPRAPETAREWVTSRALRPERGWACALVPVGPGSCRGQERVRSQRTGSDLGSDAERVGLESYQTSSHAPPRSTCSREGWHLLQIRNKPPPAGPEGARMRACGGRSAADPEHLAAA